MKVSITGATFLLVGASTVAVFAADTTGSNLTLNGSDTLFEVTKDVLTKCDGTQMGAGNVVGKGLDYQGGGSGVGENQMVNDNQEISPMSRAVGNVFCSKTIGTHGDATQTVQDLMIGLDGIAIVANQTTSCVGNGVSKTGALSVLAGGTGAPVVGCPGCDSTSSSTYTFADSLDPLKIIYGGRTHEGTVNCAGDVRKSLVKQWHALFSTTCADGTCDTRGLTHAWRRADLSGTTDAFQGLVGIKAGSGATAFGIGTLPTCVGTQTKGCVPAAPGIGTNVPGDGTTNANTKNESRTINPFCNAADLQHAGTAADPFAPSNGGKSDYGDNDPIRTACTGRDDVCGPASNLGLVLPIIQGDTTTVLDSDNFPTQICQPGAFELQDNLFGSGQACPAGPQFLGKCFQPYYLDGLGNKKYDCMASAAFVAFGAPSSTDGRVWNLPLKKDDGSGHLAGYVRDANRNVMTASFFRIHQNHVASYSATGTPTCAKQSDTEQIGCLVNADPCSIGYAGREAVPTSGALNQALLVNNIAPSSANIAKLLTDTTNRYPLSRRLFFASLIGFPNVIGGEKEMAKCFGNNPGIETVLAGRNFVPLSPTVDPGLAGVQCLNPGVTGGPAGCTGVTHTNCSTIDIISGTP